MNDGLNFGEYHDREALKDAVYSVLMEYGEETDEVTDVDDIRDDISEVCDSQTPIYHADRAKWFGENWSAYDDIASELGREGMGDDIMQGIGIAYCLTLERDVVNVISEALSNE